MKLKKVHSQLKKNSNEYLSSTSLTFEQKHSSPTPIQVVEQDLGVLDTQPNHNHQYRRSRPKSAMSSFINEPHAFHIVHQPHNGHIHIQNQQQQYITLLKMLKSQEIQLEEQQKELKEKQKGSKKRNSVKQHHIEIVDLFLEIDYREKVNGHNSTENQYRTLKEYNTRLTSECQVH